jgi:hypothetical protein
MYAPNIYNVRGTLTLKADVPMDYSRGVMSNKWQVKREGEPKTNELWSGKKPSLHQSTYKVVSQQIDNTDFIGLPETFVSQQNMFESKKEFVIKEDKNPMVDNDNAGRVNACLVR